MLTHNLQKPFNCNQCSYTCTQTSSLKMHMFTHSGEKPVFCNQCNYKCTTAGNLENHIFTHTGEKPFACKQCNYFCTQSSNLKRHMKKLNINQSHFKPWNGAVPEIDICINIPLLHWHKTTTLLQILHNLYWSTDGALGPGIFFKKKRSQNGNL